MDTSRLVLFLLGDRHGVPGRSRRPAPAIVDAACLAIPPQRLASRRRHLCGVSSGNPLPARISGEPGPNWPWRHGRLRAADFAAAELLVPGGSLIGACRNEQCIDDTNFARSLADQDRGEVAFGHTIGEVR